MIKQSEKKENVDGLNGNLTEKKKNSAITLTNEIFQRMLDSICEDVGFDDNIPQSNIVAPLLMFFILRGHLEKIEFFEVKFYCITKWELDNQIISKKKTPYSLNKEILVRNLEFHTNSRHLRKLAEFLSVEIALYAFKYELQGDMASSVNNNLLIKGSPQLTKLESSFCSSYSYIIPNLNALADSKRLEDELNLAYKKKFNINKQNKKNINTTTTAKLFDKQSNSKLLQIFNAGTKINPLRNFPLKDVYCGSPAQKNNFAHNILDL